MWADGRLFLVSPGLVEEIKIFVMLMGAATDDALHVIATGTCDEFVFIPSDFILSTHFRVASTFTKRSLSPSVPVTGMFLIFPESSGAQDMRRAHHIQSGQGSGCFHRRDTTYHRRPSNESRQVGVRFGSMLNWPCETRSRTFITSNSLSSADVLGGVAVVRQPLRPRRRGQRTQPGPRLPLPSVVVVAHGRNHNVPALFCELREVLVADHVVRNRAQTMQRNDERRPDASGCTC